MAFISGFSGSQLYFSDPLINCETPEMVPPVPTPDTNTSISPSVSLHTSGPVVSLCTFALASFSNCCSMTPFPSNPSTISFALASAPGTAVSLGVNTTSAPSAISIILRSTDMVSGMVSMHLYPRSRAMNARAMPVFPDVGSTRTDSPGVMRPLASASSIRERPRRSLTEEQGPRDSSFPSSFTPLLTSTPWATKILFRSISGVLPIRSDGRDATFRWRV
mmetsp:Transcript_26476/g.56333  ORF Transcript_26476/g.56333 Transcript_26476/m.56333 type:complete len:220 (-) Transcript_26476:171-830(-)